eukprot:709493_1
MSIWTQQHGLNGDVLSALLQGVDSLNDLKCLKTEERINDFVNSLGLKSFIMKMKLTDAIKENQNDSKSNNDSCDKHPKEAQKVMQRQAIRWEEFESRMEKKNTIKIQSNKSGTIKIDKSKQTRKERLSEWRSEYLMADTDNYFSAMGQTVKKGYDLEGVVSAGINGIGALINTIVPIFPILYGIQKHNQSKEDENLNY